MPKTAYVGLFTLVCVVIVWTLPTPTEGTVRNYYLAALEVDWDYAPGFTDASFTKQLPVEDWQGFVGPLIKAEVGDTVKVHFRNFATLRNFSNFCVVYYFKRKSYIYRMKRDRHPLRHPLHFEIENV
ncbi:HEPH-like protein [Mya arenaria]|uniref:HEPH-like protein n=1 Tax=Mya arenaria TaxID=6604 RepID=A0ABY7FMG5_MYAAR|nr:HEPH-like protein [Mya arenaria]